MILYNVTLILDEPIEQEWLLWMKETHIPEVMATECFIGYRMLKVLDSPNEGVTYCVQYTTNSLVDYERYQTNFAPQLQASLNSMFKNRFVAYRSLMEFIDK